MLGPMPLQPIERRSVADAVYEQLLEEVLTGELESGEPLPGERELTHTLQANRQAVREALQRLAQAGIVDIRHGDRTRVLDYRSTAGLDLLPRLLVRPDGTADTDVARSIMELRLCLGPDVARRCAERAGSATRREIDRLVDEMGAHRDDLATLADLDLILWDRLVDGSDNIAYRLAFNALRRTYEPIQALLREVLADELRDVETRRVIAAAISAGDGASAASASARLLGGGAEAVEGFLRELNDRDDRTAT
jgi:GntR family transcriptional regulator, transcriptional repressor for pyruvate dehydrogenase complex